MSVMFALAVIYIALISQSVWAAPDKTQLVPTEFGINDHSNNRN